MIAVAATIAASVAVGIATERRLGATAQRAARAALAAMLWVLVPFVVFFNVAHLHVDTDVGGGLALAYVALALAGALAWLVGTRVLALDRPRTGTVMCGAIHANTGYLGLPLAAALLGSSRLGEAAAYDALVGGPAFFVGVFALAAAFGARGGSGLRERIEAFALRNPPLLAVVAGLAAPASLAPDGLVDASHVVVYALAPLGFFAVGVTLAAEAEEGVLPVPPPLDRAILATVLLRLLVAPALLLALAAPLIDLPSGYLLLAAMPMGINSLVAAHAYGLDLRIASAAIAWSTAVVLAGGLAVAAAG